MWRQFFNSTRRSIAACLLGPLLSVCAGAAESPGTAAEPVDGGKPLSYWVFSDPENPGGYLGGDAERAVKDIGTNGIPFLIKWMEPDSPNRIVNSIYLYVASAEASDSP